MALIQRGELKWPEPKKGSQVHRHAGLIPTAD